MGSGVQEDGDDFFKMSSSYTGRLLAVRRARTSTASAGNGAWAVRCHW